MAAFDRSDFVSEGAFSLTEFESTGEAGGVSAEIALEQDTAAIAVIVEGMPTEAAIEIDGERMQPESVPRAPPTARRTLYFRAVSGAGKLKIQLRSKGERVKVSVLRLMRRFKEDLKKRLSCTACKRLLRFVISWLITGFGLPDVPLDGSLPKAFWDWLRALLTGDPAQWPPVAAKMLKYLSKPIIEALKWLAALVNELYQPIDALLEKACMWLGFCTKGA